jgi:hypothetical protein
VETEALENFMAPYKAIKSNTADQGLLQIRNNASEALYLQRGG